ncbi:hypothetical protein TRIUR3_28833 [Triticum urartu]|uniref:Uncharacterized protein n=1 Tax=Triticum urartu TaxID=4572 RepID=M8ANT0_TRIUA|nr:hypothetical protein TRIUR3_28833 [Triticum urartu]
MAAGWAWHKDEASTVMVAVGGDSKSGPPRPECCRRHDQRPQSAPPSRVVRRPAPPPATTQVRTPPRDLHRPDPAPPSRIRAPSTSSTRSGAAQPAMTSTMAPVEILCILSVDAPSSHEDLDAWLADNLPQILQEVQLAVFVSRSTSSSSSRFCNFDDPDESAIMLNSYQKGVEEFPLEHHDLILRAKGCCQKCDKSCEMKVMNHLNVKPNLPHPNLAEEDNYGGGGVKKSASCVSTAATRLRQ